MKHVLIANLGNRNLLHIPATNIKLEQKLYLEDALLQFSEKYKNSSFLESSAKALEELENGKVNIKDFHLNIINTPIVEEMIDEVYLFYTNQKENHTGASDSKEYAQDTLHAYHIVKRIFECEKHPTTPPNVQMKAIGDEDSKMLLEGSPVDAGRLISQFLGKLREIFRGCDRKETRFFICDSGGTPQQKTALKIASEFISNKYYQSVYELDESEEQLQVEYIQVEQEQPESSGKTAIEVKEEDGKPYCNLSASRTLSPSSAANNEYKDIITLQQIKLLISKGKFSEASSLSESLNGNNHEILQGLLWAMALRFEMQHDTAIQLLKDKKIPKKVKGHSELHKLLKAYQDKQMPESYEHWKNQFEEGDFLFLYEALQFADYYYFHLKDYTRAIHFYQVFMEEYVKNFKEVWSENTKEHNKKLQSGIKQYWRLVQDQKPGEVTRLLALSFKLLHSGTNGSQRDFGIDKFRNPFAHKGIGVSEALLKDKLNTPIIAIQNQLYANPEQPFGYFEDLKKWAHNLSDPTISDSLANLKNALEDCPEVSLITKWKNKCDKLLDKSSPSQEQLDNLKNDILNKVPQWEDKAHWPFFAEETDEALDSFSSLEDYFAEWRLALGIPEGNMKELARAIIQYINQLYI